MWAVVGQTLLWWYSWLIHKDDGVMHAASAGEVRDCDDLAAGWRACWWMDNLPLRAPYLSLVFVLPVIVIVQ